MHKFILYTNRPFLDWEALFIITHALIASCLDCSNALCGAAIEDHPEVATDPECSGTHSFGCPTVHPSYINAVSVALAPNCYPGAIQGSESLLKPYIAQGQVILGTNSS